MPATYEVIRAYRYALDPTHDQEQALARHAGAARWAYNHALAAKVAAHELWKEKVAGLVATGVPEAEARKQTKVPVPQKKQIQKALNAAKGDDRTGEDGACPWWHTVSTYAFQSAFIDADNAWRNWLDSLAGRRAGRPAGYPKFKKKGRSRDSFRLHHDTKKPTIRAATTRRLLLPRIGEVRVHGGLGRLTAALSRRAGVIQSVTVSRGGHRWYASVLVREFVPVPHPTRRMREGGAVGVHLGVPDLATLSTGETFANPHVKARHARALARANRVHARRVAAPPAGSRRRELARRRVARLHHLEAERRATGLHQISKSIATRFELAAVPADDYQAALSRRPKRSRPVNRAVADASPGELRRQLGYKLTWRGGELTAATPGDACSGCGAKTTPSKPGKVICNECQSAVPRALNAARLLRQHVAPGTGETLNARGADVRPPVPGNRRRGQAAAKREDPAVPAGPPRGSDAPASPTTP